MSCGVGRWLQLLFNLHTFGPKKTFCHHRECGYLVSKLMLFKVRPEDPLTSSPERVVTNAEPGVPAVAQWVKDLPLLQLWL